MTQRPSASTLKVGTRRSFGKHVYVVKTRKAHKDSQRRVKYWARAPNTKRAAPKKRAIRRRQMLRGGFNPKPILQTLSNLDSPLMQYYRTIDLYNLCEDIAKFAHAKLLEFDADPDLYLKKREVFYKNLFEQGGYPQIGGVFTGRDGQTKAIVAAHETYYGTPCERDFDCLYTIVKNGVKRVVKVMAAPTDSVFDAVQANTPWPVYQVTAGKPYAITRWTTFADPNMKLLRQLLFVEGEGTGAIV